VVTNKQRREAARRKLERQLVVRQEQARRRRRGNVIASVAGAVIIVAIVVTFVIIGNGSGSNSSASATTTPAAAASAAGAATSIAGTTSTAAATSTAPSKSYPPAAGAAVAFDGVRITGAADLKGRPGVTAKGTLIPKTVLYKDLVVGKGSPALTTQTVTVQYIGALYRTGAIFDESWKRGAPTSFPLANVVAGFKQGIAGSAGKIPAMRVGGRRVVIIPSALGYGKTAQSGIPANSTLVFVIDLTKVAAA
jgi:peptidylprolyl isomerase